MTNEGANTWQDQLIELNLPGVGAITACADPELFRDSDGGPAGADADDTAAPPFRRREPTAPPERSAVRATLRDRRPIDLEHTWLVLPALGPVLPTQHAEGMTVADPEAESGREAEDGPGEPTAPSLEGVRAGAHAAGDRQRMRPPHRSWFRLPVVAAALRSRGGIVAQGALVGPRREWFEPAVAAREDLLAAHPDQALERALLVAREQGQAAVLRIGPRGLDIHPTGTDPRVPQRSGIPLLVTRRPAQCPLQGGDCSQPCRPVGGPWIASAQRAQVDWEARRSQALALLPCGVCFGEALPPEPDQPAIPRLAQREPMVTLERLHLRGGAVVRIDPISPRRAREQRPRDQR